MQWMLLPSALVCPAAPEYQARLMLQVQGADRAPRARVGQGQRGCRGEVSPVSLSLMNEPLVYHLQ